MLYLTSRNNLMADAFFIMENRLMFASLHGRDADMLAFQAQLQVGRDYSADRLGFRQPEDQRSWPMYTTADILSGLSKHVIRYQTHNYGAVTHMFLYATELTEFNREAKSGWVLLGNLSADMDKAVWQCLQELSDVPLLDHWQNCLLAELGAGQFIQRFNPTVCERYAMVGIKAAKVEVPTDFGDRITDLLRNKSLTS